MNIGQIFIESHRSAWELVTRRSTAVLVIAIGGVVTALVSRALHATVSNEIAFQLFNWLADVACLWFTAPATVSIFRFLILGEITDAAPWRRSAESDTYFNGAALLSLITLIPTLLEKVIHSVVASGGTLTGVGTMFGLMIAIWLYLLRLTTYLPGLAVGRPSKTIALAITEAKGRLLYIIGSYVVAAGPMLALGVAVYVWAQQPVVRFVLDMAVSIPFALLMMSAAALLYQQLHRDEVVQARGPSERASVSDVVQSVRGQRRAFGRLSYSAPDAALASPFAASTDMPRSRIRTAYADLFNIVREMWPVLLVLVAMYFVCAMAWFFAPTLVGTWVGRMVMRMLIFIGVAWLTAPFYVALHRFIATGEVRWIPPLGNYDGAGRAYFGWAGMTVALWFMPLILGDVADAFSRFGVLIELICFIAIFCILPRMTTLLPAAALDPDRAGWAQAMDDSRGRAFSFFASTTVGALPAIIALALLGQAAAAKTIQPVPFFALAVPALLVLQLIPLVIGTRIYMSASARGPSIERLQQVIRQR